MTETWPGTGSAASPDVASPSGSAPAQALGSSPTASPANG
jgi:hypothetical protein